MRAQRTRNPLVWNPSTPVHPFCSYLLVSLWLSYSQSPSSPNSSKNHGHAGAAVVLTTSATTGPSHGRAGTTTAGRSGPSRCRASSSAPRGSPSGTCSPRKARSTSASRAPRTSPAAAGPSTAPASHASRPWSIYSSSSPPSPLIRCY